MSADRYRNPMSGSGVGGSLAMKDVKSSFGNGDSALFGEMSGSLISSTLSASHSNPMKDS